MKRNILSLTVLTFLIVILGNWSWAACPEDTSDHGQCDSINVEKWWADTLFSGGGPYFARVPIFLTHDVAEPATDSIAGMQFPLCYTNSNPANYCSLSAGWNTTVVSTNFKSIFRHLIAGTDADSNWMLRQKTLGEDMGEDWVWSNRILNLDGTSHFWLLLAPTVQPLFGQSGEKWLIATMTFKMQDTMHVCIDSCFWPPGNSLAFSRPNGQTWVPRDNMPYCFWVGSPQIRVTAPNGGEHWEVGGTQNITWLSENFNGADVKIDYSTNSGADWLPVIGSTPNNGSYQWTNIPNTPSTLCRVRVADTDGDPYDISDADFTIETPPQPDFTIDATPDTDTVQVGESAEYTVTLTSLNGFTSPCTLTITGLPANTSHDFDPDIVIPTGTSDLTVTTTATTPPGTYSLTITAAQHAKPPLQHSTQVVLVVIPAPSFNVEVDPDTQEVYAGDSVEYSVILESLYGFASPCTLTLRGLPADASVDFDPDVLTPTDSSKLQITTGASTPTGAHAMWVIATEMTKGVVDSAELVLIVSPKPDFTIDAQPDTQTVQAGSSVDFDVILTSLYGFSSPCTLTISGLPVGASESFNPNPVIPTNTSNLQISVADTTDPGTYNVTVTATEMGKGASHSAEFALIVTIQVEPDTQQVQAGDCVDYDIILTSLIGLVDSCTLTVTGLPLYATASFDPNPVAPEDTSIMTICAADTTPPGTYYLTVIATDMGPGKKQPQYTVQVVLIITPKFEFAIDVFPDSIFLPRGRDTSYTVVLTSINGFDSPCTLTVSGLPAGVIGSFDDSILVPTNTTKLNVFVPDTTSTGLYVLTITATEMTGGKALQHSKDVKLVVSLGTWAFYIDAFPDTQGVVVEDSTTYEVVMFPNTGFTAPCTLSIESGLPPNTSHRFDPVVVAPHDTSVLTIITTGSTPLGMYELTIKGKVNPRQESTTTVFLAVQDFDISAKPDTVYVTQGQPAGYMVKLTSLFGFDDPCTLTVSGLPDPPNSGVFDQNKLTPTDSTSLTISTTAETDTGWYTLTITGQRMLAKFNGLVHSIQVKLKVNEASDVGEWADNPNAPKSFALFQNQPNPFNPETKISYYLPRACQAKLTIYNVLGQRVKTLFDGHQEAGMQNLTWNGRDDDGNQLSSGIYFYRLQADDFIQTRKMSLVK
jgi:hypothetical protein